MGTFYLKIGDAYNFLIGLGYKLFIDGEGQGIAVLKRWTGTQWVLVYQVRTNKNRINYWDGTNWVRVGIR